MLETGNTLVNKLMVRLARGEGFQSELEIGDIVLGLLYRQISHAFNAIVDWRAFSRGGIYASSDSGVYGVSASAQTQDGHVLWATRLTVRDSKFARRKWYYHWSIVHISENEIWLYYAKCYRDNMAGSIKLPTEPPLSRDSLPDALFFSPAVKCMCGQRPYPTAPVELTEDTMQPLIETIQDERRYLPIMLITCSDVIPPEYIMDLMLGNMIVYWSADAKCVERLNNLLPRETRTQWDSVHILMPLSEGKAFHQTYTYEEIRTIGVESFVMGLHRAFCESIRGRERHAFPTVEDVESCRNRGQLIRLASQCDSQKVELDEMTKRLAKQTDELLSTLNLLEETRRSLDAKEGAKDNAKDIADYEELLDESLKENSDLRRGISDLSTRLYTSMGIGFQPNEQEPIALLQELSHAIYAALACVGSRK